MINICINVLNVLRLPDFEFFLDKPLKRIFLSKNVRISLYLLIIINVKSTYLNVYYTIIIRIITTYRHTPKLSFLYT